MENNIDVKRLNDRAESVQLLLDYYGNEDIILVYIYDIIAYILSKASDYKQKKTMNIDVEKNFLNLLLLSVRDNELQITYNSLSTMLEYINDYNFSKNSFINLYKLYCYNEKLLENEYQFNLQNVSNEKKRLLKEEIKLIKSEMKRNKIQLLNNSKIEAPSINFKYKLIKNARKNIINIAAEVTTKELERIFNESLRLFKGSIRLDSEEQQEETRKTIK